MTGLITQPQVLAAAAADASEISSAIGAAKAAAAGPTTGLAAAAEDEVSAVTASLFGAYGQQYQALLQRATVFHQEFVAALAAAGNAYAQTEAAASNSLGTLEGDIQALLSGNAAPAASTVAGAVTNAAPMLPAGDPVTTVVMGASGYPIPSQLYIDTLAALYVNPPLGTLMGLNTPEGLYPLTGVKDLTLDVSVARGLTILNNTIQTLAPGPGNTVNVFGYSQSAVIASLEMHALDPTNMPYPLGTSIPTGNLNFSLVGDPANPNGGLLARFPGLTLSSLGLTFGTATPDNSFPTKIYTIEYDGFGDFPQYPIDFLSDVNAFLGIVEVHGTYPFFTASQVNAAIPLTNTTGNTLTQYYILPTQNLPLLDPVRAIPVIGNPIADLVQPDLRVLVDLGYGSTTQGWSPDAPNVPTPFGVIPPVSPGSVVGALATGTQQGIGAFVSDVRAEALSPPAFSLPSLTSMLGGTGGFGSLPALTSPLSSPDNFIAALQSANTNFVGAISTSASDAYATLLPTADIANALVTSVPSYDVNLFLSGVEQVINGDPTGGLIYAFGAPVAVDVAMGTLAGGFEFRVIESAATSIIDTLTGTIPPSPPGG
jgi:PE-PPE domain/PE family